MKTEAIVSDLIKLGIQKDMKLMIHSSLKSFGYVEDGPRGVIEALQKAVGENGLILMPSFNHGHLTQDGDKVYYDPKMTPTTNGKIPDTFWRMPNVYRSLHPTHAVAVWGKNAESYTKDHHQTIIMGEDSPFGRITLENGYLLHLGTNHDTTSIKHLAEILHRSPCINYRVMSIPIKLSNEKEIEGRSWSWREKNCPIIESGKFFDKELDLRNSTPNGTQKRI